MRRRIKMIDLKNFNNSIEISSQEQLDTLLKVFKQAGLPLYNNNDILYDLDRPTIFTRIGDSGWASLYSDLGCHLDGTIIQFKDFMKELKMSEMKYKQGDILIANEGYRKVLGVCGEVYFMSYSSENIEGENLKQHFDGYTQHDLDIYGCKLYTPPEEVETKLSYKPFSPKEEEKYFYLSPSGRVLSSAYYSDGMAYKWDAESGNCFRTKEEAEYHRDWLIARKRIMDSLDSDSSWENPKQEKWTIYYDYANRHLKVIDRYYNQHVSFTPYKSKEEAEQALQDLEDEYLVYFGIKRSLNE